jgi:hypothetical protein
MKTYSNLELAYTETLVFATKDSYTSVQLLGLEQLTVEKALLPGPKRGCLQILEKNSAKWEKILHFLKLTYSQLKMIK